MGCGGSEILTMIFIITFLIFLSSFQRTHILTVNASFFFKDHHDESKEQQEEESGKNSHHVVVIKKISSGIDESEEKEAMIVENFRILLGLKSFYHNKNGEDSSSQFLLSPSPSPAPAPAPSPVLHLHHHHFHHPLHHWKNPPPLNRTHLEDDRGRANKRRRRRRRRVLVAVLASVAAVSALICACCLILLCRKKLRNHKTKKKHKRTMPLRGRSIKNKGSVDSSSIDLFYLDSLVGEEEDIEQNACTLKKSSCDNNASDSCSTKEILPVHDEEEDDVESMKHESESESGDEIVHPSSSDSESFHSIVDDSQSNASNDSVISDTLLSMSPQNPSLLLPNQFDSLPQPPQLCSDDIPKQEKQESVETTTHPVQCVNSSPPPPPPPLPPPTPPPRQMPLFALHSLTSPSSSSSRASSSYSPLSLTSHNLSPSPRKSETFSGSNQSPAKFDFPSPPPPPCPPPFPNSIKKNGAKTPPPPLPSQLPQFSALGKDGAPLPKLKPLHWDKVRAAPNRTMVWDKLRSSSFELDEEMIESLFGYNLQSSIKNDETKSKSPSPSKHVLEPKRLQNITILSKALNATPEHVCEALIQGKGLCLQQLEALVKMVPTKEEECKLSNYKGDIKELGSAERFVRAILLCVPFAFQRVQAMLYKETFEDEVVHLRNSFSMLEEACKELRSSRLFLKLLETVLKTGNRMNVGTIRGGARAFKLDALLKLADVKGVDDGKTTLLHFVVQEIVRSEGMRVSDSIMGKISSKKNNSSNKTEDEKEEDYKRMGLELVSGLSTELYNVKKTATVDLDVLASSVSNLSDEMTKLKELLLLMQQHDEGELGRDGFVNCMKCFLRYGERKVKELKGDEDRVMGRVKEITEYFHGEVVSKEDHNPLRIFVIVRDFLGMLDSVCKELRRSKATRTPNPLAPFR